MIRIFKKQHLKKNVEGNNNNSVVSGLNAGAQGLSPGVRFAPGGCVTEGTTHCDDPELLGLPQFSHDRITAPHTTNRSYCLCRKGSPYYISQLVNSLKKIL